MRAYGVTAEVIERRRYGTTTYTWMRFTDEDGIEHFPDPWPAVTPRRSEVEAECARIAARGEVVDTTRLTTA